MTPTHITIGMRNLINQVDMVVRYVFGVDDVTLKVRKHQITIPRQLCHLIAHKYYGLTQTLTGQRFGGHDHSTVFHSCGLIRDLYLTGDENKEKIDQVFALLKMNNADIDEMLDFK